MSETKYEFFRIEGDRPLYLTIEDQLEAIGLEAATKPSLLARLLGKKPEPTDQWAGFAFKQKVLRAAGWDMDQDGSYISDPERAAKVFHKIEQCLEQTRDPQALLTLVSK